MLLYKNKVTSVTAVLSLPSMFSLISLLEIPIRWEFWSFAQLVIRVLTEVAARLQFNVDRRVDAGCK